MTIEDRVKEVLGEEKNREKSRNFQNLRDFYEAMKREGLVIKQQYTLPPIDTVGRSLYEPSKPANQEEKQE